MSILPTPELLRNILRYEPTTGKLYWLPRPLAMFNSNKQTASHNMNIWNGMLANKEAFTADSMGYRIGRIHNTPYKAHRVIWAIVYGQWPICDIDHINGIRNDNRIDNLREVVRSENMRNQRIRSDNTSGIVGVSWSNVSGKWMSQIKTADRNVYLGVYENKKDAIKARKEAEIKYGFHKNHGRVS